MKPILLPCTCTLALALGACGAPSEGSRTGAAPAQASPAADAPAATPDAGTSETEQPANPDFIGRVWVSTTPGSARGSIMVFLPDRTLLMDSCFETYRLTRWGVAGEHIRWIEDSIPIEAEVILPARDTLRLRIAGQDRVQTYIAADPPYVCPDMPR